MVKMYENSLNYIPNKYLLKFQYFITPKRYICPTFTKPKHFKHDKAIILSKISNQQKKSMERNI